MLQVVNEGDKKGHMPLAPKNPNNVPSTFFNTTHLFLKDLSFEYGGDKLVSYPGRHLISVCP